MTAGIPAHQVSQQYLYSPSRGAHRSLIHSSPLISIQKAEPVNKPCTFPQTVKEIPKCGLDYYKDERWMMFVNELFGIASHICSLLEADEIVPYLRILSAPVYLYHAIKEANERFKLSLCAFKASKIADVFFWAGMGIGSFGNALNSIIKPLTGGVSLFGLTNIPAVGLTFTYIFPIILIALSVIDGTMQGWSLARTTHAYRRFTCEKDKLDGSLKSLENVLFYLQGPHLKQGADIDVAQAEYELNKKAFSREHFASQDAELAVSARISAVLGFNAMPHIRSVKELIAHLVPLIQQGRRFIIEPSIHETNPFESIEETLTLCERVLSITRTWETKEPTIVEALEKLEKGHNDILEIKNTLYSEGMDISDDIKKDMKRKLAQALISIITSCINLIAGGVFLALPLFKTIGSYLSLTSSMICALTIIYNKTYPSESMYQTKRFIELIKKEGYVSL